MDIKHIFYVSSNFHLLICLEIINKKKLLKKNILFINNRGTVFPSEWKDNVLALNGENCFNFYAKLKGIFSQDLNLSFFDDKYEYVAYIPFARQIPYSFFKKIVFFEEGFSSHASNFKYSILFKVVQRLKSSLKYSIVNLFLFKKPKGLKKFVHGSLYFYKEFQSNRPFEYFTLSRDVVIDGFRNIEVKVINISESTFTSNIPFASCIIVLDGFSSNTHYSRLNCFNYLNILAEIYFDQKIFLKFHPSDFNNTIIKSEVLDFFKKRGCDISIINLSLENIAIENKKLKFIGTNSTILFYAPLLGNNSSISFVKYMSIIDKDYRKFLMAWGGVDKFISIFQKNVEIIDTKP